MEKPIFSDEFKRDVVAQITERGYPIAEISQRLGAHPPYAWKGQLAKALSSDASRDVEVRQLKRELAPVTEERDVLRSHRVFRSRCKARSRSLPSIATALACGNVPLPRRAAQRFPCLSEEACNQRAREDAVQTDLTHKAWTDSGKVYGYRKLHDDLLDHGETCCPTALRD